MALTADHVSRSSPMQRRLPASVVVLILSLGLLLGLPGVSSAPAAAESAVAPAAAAAAVPANESPYCGSRYGGYHTSGGVYSRSDLQPCLFPGPTPAAQGMVRLGWDRNGQLWSSCYVTIKLYDPAWQLIANEGFNCLNEARNDVGRGFQHTWGTAPPLGSRVAHIITSYCGTFNGRAVCTPSAQYSDPTLATSATPAERDAESANRDIAIAEYQSTIADSGASQETNDQSGDSNSSSSFGWTGNYPVVIAQRGVENPDKWIGYCYRRDSRGYLISTGAIEALTTFNGPNRVWPRIIGNLHNFNGQPDDRIAVKPSAWRHTLDGVFLQGIGVLGVRPTNADGYNLNVVSDPSQGFLWAGPFTTTVGGISYTAIDSQLIEIDFDNDGWTDCAVWFDWQVGVVPSVFISGRSSFYRYTSGQELQVIRDSGLLRGGNPGTTYMTTDGYDSAAAARSRLALPGTPEYRIRFNVINSPSIFGPSFAVPMYGQPGGGVEYRTTNIVQVELPLESVYRLEP